MSLRTLNNLFADCHNRIEYVVQRDYAYQVGETNHHDYRRESLDESLAPADEVVRRYERADDVADAVQQSEHVGDLSVEHEYRERERRRDKYHEALDYVRRYYVHTHRPQRDCENQIADTYIDIAAVEADNQKPQIVVRLDVDIVSLLDFEAVVEDYVDENYEQNYAETDFERRFVDVRRHERTGYVADDYGYRQQQPVPYVEHPFAQECCRRREILQQNGDTVCTVRDGYRQPEGGEHRDGDNRPSAGKRVDDADYDTGGDKHYDDVPIHTFAICYYKYSDSSPNLQ